MTQRRIARRRFAALFAVLAVLALTAPSAVGQQLRLTPQPPDESEPIVITCNQAVNGTDGTVQVLLLRGGVTVEQGLLRAKMAEAVVWIQPSDGENSKPLPVKIYGEGNVLIERPGENDQKATAVLELKTRGVFRLRNNSRATQPVLSDPLYRRAVAGLQGPSKPGPGVTRLETPFPITPATQVADIPRVTQQEVAAPLLTNQGADAPRSPMPEPPAILQTSTTIEPLAVEVKTVEVIPTQAPAGPPEPEPSVGPPRALPSQRLRRVQIAPRDASRPQIKFERVSAEEQAAIVTGGVTVYADDVEGMGSVDISADRAVVWLRNVDAQRFLTGLGQGQTTREHIEVYMEGHVEIRQAEVRGPNAGTTRLLLADQVYYDISRNVALLIKSEMITRQPGVPEPIHMQAEELRQTAPGRFEATRGMFFASRLPSDPGLKVAMREARVEERKADKDHPKAQDGLYAQAQDIVVRVENVPVMYFPYAAGDLGDPLGPVQQIRFRNDKVMGFGVLLDLDGYGLLGIDPPPRSNWRVDVDYLSLRGPAAGTEFDIDGKDLFGIIPGEYKTLVRAYGIHDEGTDILGGPRTFEPPKEFRGRFLARHRQDFTDDTMLLAQFSYLSDRNFLEQFFEREFDEERNQETFVYLKHQQDNWAVSVLGEPRIRSWVTETEWLPRADGYWLGESFFDRFTYFAHANAGYAVLRPTSDLPPGYVETPIPGEFDRTRPLPPSSDLPHHGRVETGRLDLWQELDFPFELGPFNVVPYGILDVTHYTETLTGNDDTRLYGGPGLRASIPFTRIYPDACSTLFNVNGIAHKITFETDYRYVQSGVDFRELPELDRLDDDAGDQARRDLRTYRLTHFAPGTPEFFLATSPLYDPQLYAIRRGIETATDTLDDLQVLRAGINQRWQTKRGFPGHQHIIDWMILDLRGTYFPEADRDNFGHALAFLEYDYTWHLGDRTTLLSSGWLDPYADGARVFNMGLFLDRAERIQYYIGYRKIDPVGSEAVIVSSSVAFSPKWAATASSTYDFGENQSLGNSLILTRIGSDLQFSLGLVYQPLQKNFGFTVEILPTLAPRQRGLRVPGGRGGPLTALTQ